MLSDGAIHRHWNNRLETFSLHTLNQLNMPDDVELFLMQVGIPLKSLVLDNFLPYVDIADGETDYIKQSLPMFVSFITELDHFMHQVASYCSDADVKALVDLRHKLAAQVSQAFINLYTGLWSMLFENLFYELKS